MVRKTVKEIIKACDLFSQPAAFRYGDQPQYQSLTGGIVSILVFVLFAAIFTNTIISTFNKQQISSKMTSVQQEDPSFYQVGVDSFMFAVGISGIDMNQGERWFQLYMEKRISNSSGKFRIQMPLQKCDKSQWVRIKEEMNTMYDRVGFDTWLCPPDGTKIQIQGKYSSDVFKYYKFGVKQCNTTSALSATRPCVNSSRIQSFLNANQTFTFNFYYINTIINPKNKDYLSNYLDDLNYFPFTPTDGITANFFLSAFQITTDQSIYPYQEFKYDHGGISTAPAQTINYRVRQKDYLKFYIRKSSLSISIQRNFKKIDETLSYIGGLFSAIITVLFIMTKYNQLSYEMEIAKNLYHYDKNVPLKSDQFNFLVFLGYLIYAFFETICIKLPWKRMEVYFRSLEEVRKQMDIRLVMKKVLYSERVAIAVFDEPKAQILHLQEPLTLEQAENIRKAHRFYDKLESKYFDYEKIRQEAQKQERQSGEDLQIQSRIQSTKKQMNRTHKNLPLSLDQIFLSEIAPKPQQQKPRQRLHRMNTTNMLRKTYKNKKNKQKEAKTKTNALNILNLFINQEERKQNQLNCMIEEMKEYVAILQREAEEGDVISQRILDKFDHKLMKIFLLNDERQQNVSIEMSPIKNSENVNLSRFTINLACQGSQQNIGSNKKNSSLR